MSQLANMKLYSIMRDQHLRKEVKARVGDLFLQSQPLGGSGLHHEILFLNEGYSSLVEHWPSKYKAQESFLGTVANDK